MDIKSIKSKRIIFLGFNGFKDHKRGVENVIQLQSYVDNNYKYYIHWGSRDYIYKFGKMICISINHSSHFKYIRLNKIIRRILRHNHRNAIIHSHNYLMTVMLYCKTDIFTIHDGLAYLKYSTGDDKPLSQTIYRIIEKIAYRKARKIHVISEYTKAHSQLDSNRREYSLIYNSSHYEDLVERFQYNAVKFYESFPYLLGKNYCLSVRSLEHRANIVQLIQVAKNYPNLEFVIAGKGPLYDKLQKQIINENINNFHLLGYVPDDLLFHLYKYSSFIITPALYGEGFGLPIIEGYLFNKPVIASNVCAIPEVIMSSEYLFDNNIESISRAIEFCMCKIDDKSFREYYDRNFSNSSIIHKYRLLYSSLE